MSMLVRVTADDDGPIAVKTATSDDDRVRLALEAERLRLGHPGLVALVGSEGLSADGELRTRFAGDPASQWTGSLACAAGLGAAVAATLADLHAVGIVHARLDASHVLVGHDGRPRLCGLSHVGEASPSDDVLALGRMLDDLLRRLPGERRPLGRWSRGDAAARRALERAIARALDPVATRRPSAATLAATILDAVPGAALPDQVDDVTLDDPWGRTDLVPSHDPWGRTDDDLTSPDHEDDELPDDRQKWSHVDPTRPAHPVDLPPGPPDAAHDDELLEIAFAHEMTEDERWAEAFGDDPEAEDRRAGWDHDAVGRSQARAETVSTPRDRSRSDQTRPRRTRLSALLGTGGVFAAGMIAVAFLVVTRAEAPGGSTPDGSTAAPNPTAGGCPDGGESAAGPASEPIAEPTADVDGDGCADPVAVDGGTITAGSARWTLGEPGDVAAVGDWDCDGDASPALLRPETGDVFVFPRWAAQDQPVTVEPTGNVDGSVGIRAQRRPDGCDDLLVDLASGPTETVEVPS